MTSITEADYARLTGQVAPRRTNKYGAKQVVVTDDGVLYDAKAATANGIQGKRFDSKAEGARYVHLRLLERGGYIRDLECQPKFEIHAADAARTKVATYRGDFAYLERDGTRTIEDVKGMATPLWKMKRKLVEAEYGITVREIR
jgi:hypothetical protein